MIRSQTWFRPAFMAFAMILGAQAAWILAGELARTLPGDGGCAAARLARWRGDLWGACARQGSQAAASQAGDAADAAGRAVRLAPHAADAWLVLAHFPPPGASAVDCLKMSYYTGPSQAELIPLRLFVSVRPAMPVDDDIRRLMRHDIGTIVSRHAELKPAILAIWRQAAPEGRRTIEAAVTEIDAALLAALRASTR